MAMMPGIAQAVEPSEVYDLIFSEGDGYTNMIMQQIFGSLFGDDLATPSIFQVFIGYFNVGVFLIAVILFFWNLSVGVIQSAHEGEVMGKRWSSVWVPLRLLFVVTLMIPLSAFGGYNGGQAFVAFLVKGGTAVATKVWSVGATQVITGVAPVSAPPSDLGTTVVAGLYQMEACRKVMNDQFAKAAEGTDRQPDRIEVNRRSYYDHAVENASMWESLLGKVAGNEDRLVLTYDRVAMDGTQQSLVETAVCGTIATPHIPEYISRRMNPDADFESMADVFDASNIRSVFSTMHVHVIQDAQRDLRDLVQRIDIRAHANGRAYDVGSKEVTPGGMPQPIIETAGKATRYEISREMARIVGNANKSLSAANQNILNIAVNTPNANDAVRNMMVTRITGTCSVDAPTVGAVSPAKCFGEGWMGAGSWYMTIAHLNNEIYSLFAAQGVIGNGSKHPYSGVNLHTGAEFYDGSTGQSNRMPSARQDYEFNMNGYASLFDRATVGLASLGMNFTSSQLADVSLYTMSETDGTFGFGAKGEPGLIDRAFSDVKESIVSIVTGLHNFTFSEDPIISIWKVGNHLIDVSAVLATGDIAIPGSILSTVAAVLFTAGATMSFILPMLPFMFWILAVSGYILLVVEAVISVNLWAISMMRMDGEGISGEAGRKGWMILLALALTPLLMIGGFIVGMIIFRVTAALVGSGMALALNGILGLALVPMVAGVFVLSIMIVAFYMFIIERSFSLVATFPSKILSMVGEQVDVDAGGINSARTAAVGAATGAGATSRGVFGAMNKHLGGAYSKAKNTAAGQITSGGGGKGRRSPSSST